MELLGEATIRMNASPARVWPLLCQLIQAGDWCDDFHPDHGGIDLITALPPEQFTFRVPAPRGVVCSYRLLAVDAATQIRQTLSDLGPRALRDDRLRLVASSGARPLELTPSCERSLQRLKERVEQSSRL